MIFALLGLFSLAGIGWVANDAARRHRSWFGWAWLVSNTSILGLVLWLIVRRRSPAAGVRLSSVRRAVLWLIGVPLYLLDVLIAAFVVTFLFQIARVDGVAMQPTLGDGDRVVVNKLIYRIRSPQRDDIVMLRYPLSPDKLFVKRVVAKAGDSVRIVQGRVYVNDRPLPDDYVPDEFRSHEDWGPVAIESGGFFVMGDHRNNSSDSRHWGTVPTKYILGRINGRWWPIGRAKIF